MSFYFDVLAKDETMDHKVSTVEPLYNEPSNSVKSRFQCSPDALMTKMFAIKKTIGRKQCPKIYPSEQKHNANIFDYV